MNALSVRLCVFAKLPAPGTAKTRLIPALGEQGAARVAEALLQQCLALCEEVKGSAELELWLTPPPSDSRWQTLIDLDRFTAVSQGEGDLGGRMQRAANGGPIILIGSDCPSLARDDIDWAMSCLRQGDAAMIPAQDGGYVLLGLPEATPGVFDNVDWSTSRVAEQTRRRLHTAGLVWHERPALSDVDVIDDLSRQPAAFLRCCHLPDYGESSHD